MFKRLQHLIRLPFARTAQICVWLLLGSALLFAGSAGVMLGSAEAFRAKIETNPALTTNLLVALLQPFAAWLIYLIKRHYDEVELGETQIQLLVIVCAELLLTHPIGIFGSLLLFYLSCQEEGLQIVAYIREKTFSYVLKVISGPLTLLVFGLLIAYIQYRLG